VERVASVSGRREEGREKGKVRFEEGEEARA
jgi:hypothetical protein